MTLRRSPRGRPDVATGEGAANRIGNRSAASRRADGDPYRPFALPGDRAPAARVPILGRSRDPPSRRRAVGGRWRAVSLDRLPVPARGDATVPLSALRVTDT